MHTVERHDCHEACHGPKFLLRKASANSPQPIQFLLGFFMFVPYPLTYAVGNKHLRIMECVLSH